MMRAITGMMIILPAAVLLASCAKGSDDPWDGFAWDTGVVDTVDATGDVPPDVPWDTIPDTMPPDGLDGPIDTLDASDTPAEGTDTEPATCTVVDLVNQTMCGTGSKCTFTALGSGGSPVTFCDVAGAQGWNQTCGAGGASDNCQAGYMCLSRGGGSARCRRFCNTETICTTYPGGANASCQIEMSVGGVTAEGVTFCSFHCNLVGGTGCDTGQGCRGIDLDMGTTGYWTDCTDAGSGSGCIAGTSNDCPNGQDCFGIDSDGDTTSDYNECLQYCSYPGGYCSSGSCTQGPGWPTSIGVCFS
jgi:hypothetical protein